jgi:hypothetical protein
MTASCPRNGPASGQSSDSLMTTFWLCNGPSRSRSPTIQSRHQIDGVTALAMAVEQAEWKPEPAKLLGWLWRGVCNYDTMLPRTPPNGVRSLVELALRPESRLKARKATESASRTDEARDRGNGFRPRGQHFVLQWRFERLGRTCCEPDSRKRHFERLQKAAPPREGDETAPPVDRDSIRESA